MNSPKGFHTFNPRENKFNDIFHLCSTEHETEIVLSKSREAFQLYSQFELTSRIEFLSRIKDNLVSNKSKIEQQYLSESGLSQTRFEIEFNRTINQIQLFCDYLRNDYTEISSAQKENAAINTPELTKKNIPIGPILVIGSSNFPLAYSTIGGDTVAALAAGCTVIVKAHPMHVGTSKEVANCIYSAIEELNLPIGVFSHLIDDTYEIATKLIRDPRVKGSGFTGSIRGGRALMNLAASRPEPIPVFAEMGSTNPVIVFKESLFENIESWSKNLSQSICNDAGQFCTKPGIIFIPNTKDGIRFSEILEKKVLEFESFHMLHPSILNSFELLKNQLVELSKTNLSEKKGDLEPMQGRQAILNTSAQTLLSNHKLQEEVFGPFAILVSYNSEEEIEEYLNEIQGQLTITFLGTKKELANNKDIVRIATEKAGRVIFNGVPTGVTVCQSMNHGGPYPASSDARFTAVGTDSIKRFTRSVTYQNFFNYM
jgi:NADP-dependent aldehyde dehydrogenase